MLKRLTLVLPFVVLGCHREIPPTEQQMKTSEELLSHYLDSTETFGWLEDTGVRPPPPKFNHPFKGPIYIQWHRVEDVNEYCGVPTQRGWITEACSAEYTDKTCHMILPILDKNISERHLEEIFLHERGHCNGWNYYHDNGDDPANITKAKKLGMDKR